MIQQPHNDMREFRHYTAEDYEQPMTEVNRVLGITLEYLRQQQTEEEDER